jgi:tetratricopeptide (TPR) repeat protein
MARAAVKAKQQARAKAQAPAKAQRGRRRHAGGGDPNQELFFSRLRRRQKWVFLLLAVVFAITFAAVGVGSGNGGGLDQLFNGILGGGGTSVSKAQAEVKTDPVKGYRDLASAYLAQNDPADAIAADQSYLKLRRKDTSKWLELASLEERQGQNYVGLYQQAQQQAQLADPAQAVQPGGPLGQQLGTNPVDQYYAQQTSTQTTQYLQLATSAYGNAVRAFQTVAQLQPHGANAAAAEFQIGQLEAQLNQKALALQAYQQYVLLQPNSPNLAQIEQTCRQLGGICTPKYVRALHKKPKK